ncbi:HD-GYP domain-containing protein [Streptomyces pluripotens]|uniref:HD-GYP domain-containing protein n=1 Tax=Streptomyces pluripotens TaxID=1355015 RepID=A0A221P2M1_9ACTN|nr:MULTISPECIES: HD-GYP domain-containing protein [Streptomyces]ARP72232.1 metal-dependent phosphohydrolase [Streptomyces pluripotens]ASN26481.1 HD-GYP domain-containing protein [Streptomyces pluripotens]MCH0556107.1 HD-GYP domain-containing protein [Streptomyces sp. MUM 16J]
MEEVPARARAYVVAVVLLALLCLLPLPVTRTPWWALALLAVLYAACEHVVRRRFGGPFYPVLLTGAFLLPPPAAALVPLPAALFSPVSPLGQRAAGVRRLWRAAQPALAVWGAAQVHWALGGRDAVVASDFPFALLPAGGAVLAFCLVLTALDGGIRAAALGIPLRRAWRGLLSRALAPVAVHGLAGLMMAVLWRSPYGPVAALLVLLPMCVSWWVFAQYHRERAAHRATIRALVQAVDIKDGYTRGHSERVGRASAMIARELGMDDERVEVLRFAGILHDVGKLGVPTRLLRKEGPLTPEERRIIELHPEHGHEMVRGISFLDEARAAILHHHERLDGSGYPYGLAGAQIPECARVVAVADAFDAMTSTRSYRRARPVEAAVSELERCAGAQFDPRMVTALVHALRRCGWHPAVTADEPSYGTAPKEQIPGTGTPR